MCAYVTGVFVCVIGVCVRILRVSVRVLPVCVLRLQRTHNRGIFQKQLAYKIYVKPARKC